MPQLEIPTDRPPIYISAGVQKEESQIVHAAPEETIAAQIIGSFTEPEWAGNDDNGRKTVFWWDEETQAAYNSIGLKNPGRKQASEYLPRAIKVVQGAGQLAIISVTTLKHEDPFDVLPGLVEWGLKMGADAVEINGSCPNQSPDHPLLCHDVEATYAVADAVRARVGHDAVLGYKVSPLPKATVRRYNTEGKLAIDFIDTINTKGNQLSPINPVTDRPAIEVNDGLAGQSGPIVQGLAKQNLAWWMGFYDDDPTAYKPEGTPFQLLSTGGVTGGSEVYYRTHHMGAMLAGGAQAFYRARDVRRCAQQWAQEYVDAAASRLAVICKL